MRDASDRRLARTARPAIALTLAQTASPYFDLSVWQFVVALILGGRTHLVPDEVRAERVADEAGNS